MTETSMDVWYGQATMSDLRQTGASASFRMVEPKGVAGKSAKYMGGQMLEMTGVLNSAQKGDAAKTREAVHTATGNMSMNSVLFQLDNTPGAEGVKKALETANAAKRYGDALDAALADYLDEKIAIRERKARIEQDMRRQIDAAVEKLNAALDQFRQCNMG
jgi:hypothetical protein